MGLTIAATVIGVLLSVCFAAFATAFAWLRSDMNARFDKVDARFERLEAKVDGLIVAQARGGHPTDRHPTDQRPTDPGESDGDD